MRYYVILDISRSVDLFLAFNDRPQPHEQVYAIGECKMSFQPGFDINNTLWWLHKNSAIEWFAFLARNVDLSGRMLVIKEIERGD